MLMMTAENTQVSNHHHTTSLTTAATRHQPRSLPFINSFRSVPKKKCSPRKKKFNTLLRGFVSFNLESFFLVEISSGLRV